MKLIKYYSKFSVFLLLISGSVFAQNPLIRNQFSADPSARVFGDSVYVYPSHDILATANRGRLGWFCMEDYHVFSSADLTHWTDHGVIVSQNKVPWVKPNSYSMWAPDCIFRNGKYYFYFPSTPKDSAIARGFTVGVAVADKPSGPFIPQPNPIKGVKGIDPNVFIDKDGQAYLYWSQGNIYAAKLKSNMLELDSDPVILKALPEKGLKEGPYLFEREGKYYLTFPHVANKTERLEYAIGDNPLGPFKMTGVIMDESPNCWTNHHSIIQFKNQWYLFYHNNDLSPAFDKARSIRADSLFFNEDGTIQKVIPTLRGVGITKANEKIQMDRYSKISKEDAIVSFLDTTDTFKGWEVSLKPKGWLSYNTVDFGPGKIRNLKLRVRSNIGGNLQLKISNALKTQEFELKIKPSNDWTIINIPLSKAAKIEGIQNLQLTNSGNSPIALDWISF